MTPRSPHCAPFLRRTIPISAFLEAESRVNASRLDAVSMAPESAALEVGHDRQSMRSHARGRGARRGISRGEDSTEPTQSVTDNAKRRPGEGGCAASAARNR